MRANIASLELLAHDLTAAGRQVGQQARTVVRKTAYDIQASAKDIAPVDTGNLKSSITTSDLRIGTTGTIAAEIGPTANYGAFVENGTSRQAPQAYMGPAADRHSGAFEQAMQQLGAEVLGG